MRANAGSRRLSRGSGTSRTPFGAALGLVRAARPAATLPRARGDLAPGSPRTAGPPAVPNHSPTHTPTVERTLVLAKPDAVQRGLVGEIIRRFEQKGLKLIGLKLRQFPREVLERHYEVHKERPFFNNLVEFMGSGPVVAMAWEGKDAISVGRTLMGTTNAAEAAPGTIRGDFGVSFSNNLVHGSDGPESAANELSIFFDGEGELVDWKPANLEWVYSVKEEL